MKWKKQYTRIIKRFAIFPIEIDDEWRWLETVYIRQYRGFLGWVDEEFVDKESYLRWKKV